MKREQTVRFHWHLSVLVSVALNTAPGMIIFGWHRPCRCHSAGEVWLLVPEGVDITLLIQGGPIFGGNCDTIQPETRIYFARGCMKMLFIPWLLLLLPSFNLSSLFPPGSVIPGRDREWFGECSWSRKGESQNNITWLKSSCSPFL